VDAAVPSSLRNSVYRCAFDGYTFGCEGQVILPVLIGLPATWGIWRGVRHLVTEPARRRTVGAVMVVIGVTAVALSSSERQWTVSLSGEAIGKATRACAPIRSVTGLVIGRLNGWRSVPPVQDS